MEQPIDDNERILIYVPSPGRDPELISHVLGKAGFVCETIDAFNTLLDRAYEGATAVIISEDALSASTTERLLDLLRHQPKWSDLPVIVLTCGAEPRFPQLIDRLLEVGCVSILERPLSIRTMVSCVQASRRARRRQYEVRHLLRHRERELKQKDDFLAMLGHELRNPLTPIRTGLHVVRLGKVTTEQRDRAYQAMDRQLMHISRLVDDLLDVSRISRGKISLRRERLDIVEMIKAVTVDYRPSVEAKGLQLEMRVPNEPMWVNGDTTRLAQVIGNLLHNAQKFTEKGGRITVDVSQQHSHAMISVTDSGEGMTYDMLRRLFEPFEQADLSLDRSKGGLGLGLVLVKRLTEMHGGEVYATSDGPGCGSRFVVKLPLSDYRSGMACKSENGAMWNHTSRRVLVIEDNLDCADTMKMMLEVLGHTVELAGSGLEGVTKAPEFEPDIIICDIGLPGQLDGYGVIRQIREGPCSEVFAIAMTGYGQQEDQHRALQAGFNLHLTKPVDPLVLESVILRSGKQAESCQPTIAG